MYICIILYVEALIATFLLTSELIFVSVYIALFCTQLMKAYVAEMSCNQLLLIEFATYVYAHQDQFADIVCTYVCMCLC